MLKATRFIALLFAFVAVLCGCIPRHAHAQTALQQSDTTHPIVFLLVASSDHIAGLTGVTPVVYLSKNGATAAVPVGTVAAVDATNCPGLYKLTPTSADTGTLGVLHITATAAGADPVDRDVQIVAFNPYDGSLLGLTGVATAATQTTNGTAIAALPTASANATAVWAAGARTLTAQADTAGTTTLLSRIPGTVAAQSGDSYARLGAPAGLSHAADVAAVLTSSTANGTAIAALPTASAIATAVGSIVVDSGVSLKQATALIQAALTGKYAVATLNTTSHTQVTTYYRADGTTAICTSTVTYGTNNTTVTGRTTVWSNLP